METKILLAHGGGGVLTGELIHEAIVSRFANSVLDAMDDAAVLPAPGGRLAFTTDSYVVSPIFFPGGNIGDLAICGTVNDLAMSGAEPRYISLALILEEGLPFADLERILDAAKLRAEEADVKIVCGDTKVVPRGEADGIYINTAGVGLLRDGVELSSAKARPGDALLLSGALGLHGVTVMLARGDLSISTSLKSDVAPLGNVVKALLDGGINIRVMRDITRGGLAMAVSDIADKSNVTINVDESSLPADDARDAACDVLGLDPLHVACEGRFLAIVADEDAEKALEIMRSFPASAGAVRAGSIKKRERVGVELTTSIGTCRVLTPPRGEQLPRIC